MGLQDITEYRDLMRQPGAWCGPLIFAPVKRRKHHWSHVRLDLGSIECRVDYRRKSLESSQILFCQSIQPLLRISKFSGVDDGSWEPKIYYFTSVRGLELTSLLQLELSLVEA